MTAAPPPAPPTDPASWPPPEGPPAGPPVRAPLQRSATDKMVGGVAGGLAEYTGIDALLWRVGFVALTIAGGSGILVYLLLWLLLPSPSGGGVPSAVRYGPPFARPRRERTPRVHEPRSPLPRITLATGLIVVGVLVLLDRLTPISFQPKVFVAAALLTVGLGLIAAAFVGSRRAKAPLFVLGILLSFATLAASAGTGRFGGGADNGGFGDHIFRPDSAAAVQPDYRGGVGDMTIDLSQVGFGDLAQPVTTSIHAGVGDVQVVVPKDADVRLTVHSGLGSVDAFGEGEIDSGFFAGHGAAWSDDGKPEIELTIDSGVGDVELTRG